MHYHIYNTEAIIIGGRAVSESSRLIYLFTKDLGLVVARAQNARALTSKLRYALDDFSISRVSLVRGKNNWRLTNALPEKNLYKNFQRAPESRLVFAKAISALRSLVAGEEANGALYEIVLKVADFIESSEVLNLPEKRSENAKDIEVILMLRLLNNLGYFGDHKTFGQFVADNIWSEAMIQAVRPRRSEAVSVINKSLQAAGMV